MPRKPRIWYPGAAYHITARGNRRDSIFYDPDDYQYYMDLIDSCMEDIPFIIHAYCLMPNHIHLLLETKETPPGAIIKFIHTRYAIYFNKRHDFTGHVFQGRYHAKLIDSIDYFLRASRYIHLNPIESEIVTDPKNYIWSSYPEYMAEAKNSTFLETGRVLSFFQEPQKENYCTYVESSETQEPDTTLTH